MTSAAMRLVVLCAAAPVLVASPAASADLHAQTLAAWTQYVDTLEAQRAGHDDGPPAGAPSGQSIDVPDGTIHVWRGSVFVRGITVAALVDALSNPGLPPPADDILDARVLERSGPRLRVYMKLARRAIVTVTYDTVHDVTFDVKSPKLAMSRSVSASIRESGGGDRGFLWRLNSYWRYRQDGDGVDVDLLSVSLSRAVPALLRPVAWPVIDHVARESVVSALEAVRRLGARLASAKG